MQVSEKHNFVFTEITLNNAKDFKLLRKVFAKYKKQTLRNHGESPGSKKMFYKLFDNIIENLTKNSSQHFIVMQSKQNLIGFAIINTDEKEMITVPYIYGSVHDFYIAPEYRRKGYGTILNAHIESLFINNDAQTVLLHPDPVSGIDFWKAMKYEDTRIHQGWGRWLVFCKHLSANENTIKLDNAIQNLVTLTDAIGINPYNKPQLKEAFNVWKEYCKETNRKPRRKDVKNMAWNARNNRAASFKAIYYQGKIIGFTYTANNELNYVLPEYRKEKIL